MFLRSRLQNTSSLPESRRSTWPPFTAAGPIHVRVGLFKSIFKHLSNTPTRM